MKHEQISSKNIEIRKNSQDVINNSPVTVTKNDSKLEIQIDLKYIQDTPNFDILKLLSLLISPMFTNKNKIQIKKSIRTEKTNINNGFPHVAFFIEDMGHYTGGRYSSWLNATILSQFTKVTVITNNKPIFIKDFGDYINNNKNFHYIIDSKYLVDNKSNDFDVIVGVPNISGQFATDYAKKFKLPLHLVIFETPNWIREYRDGVDATDDFWYSYKKCLLAANQIITISNESKKWLQKWDVLFVNKNIKVLYPCINEIVAKKVKCKLDTDKTKCKLDTSKVKIIFSSRMADFKNPTSIIRQLPKNIEFIIIGKVWSNNLQVINNMIKDGYNIKLLGTISDTQKFKEICDSNFVVHPSKFEGFGMTPMESLYFNKPIIAYDLPVLREVYGNSIVYAELGNRQDFIHKIKEVMLEPNKWPIENVTNFPFITIKHNLEKQKEIFNMPKITFGVLAYNCADYLEYAIKSIYGLAHQIIIVEGAVKGYSNNFESSDGTLKIIDKLKSQDIWNKIQIIKKHTFWENKIQMQNKIASNVTGNFYIKIDADEIWKPQIIKDVINIMLNNTNIQVIKMPFYHFWTAFNVIALDAGGKWSTEHHRVWRWKKTYKHRESFNHFIDTANDNRPVVSPYVEEYKWTGDKIYHMGYARKLQYIKNKLQYYKNRNIENYVKDNYAIWENMVDLTQCTQHTRSWAEKFSGELPEVLKKHPYFGTKDIRKLEV